MAISTIILAALAAQAPGEDLGLRIPPGFRVSVYADETLANDTYAMTLDARGRVVVTSQGFVNVLHDDDGDGRADRASRFATTATGGMGLCFDGDDLLFFGDGKFSRYRDRDGDGRADGPPEPIASFRFAEHGGHAMRQGPDGWWYFMVGNDGELGPGHATMPHSPVKAPEGGALLRYSPDLRRSEIIAHGFRNPYDFDFNPAGDLFTYDSDVERVYFLPWYSPTRIYHVAHAGHHGWRLAGFLRSWARPADYLDTVDILWPVGRGSPTGVTCYRHDQFPDHYRGGLFALDWTFGKVYFFPLRPDGGTYRTEPEVFIESVGTHGFDPTDAVVAPDGSMFVSIGGRRTRGSVYRIEYVGEGKGTVDRPSGSDRDAVLRAHEPLDAWSRARWMPVARLLGPGPFAEAVADGSLDAPARVRAVEVLTELFGGLPPTAAASGAGADSPRLRARVAWSLGRAPCLGFAAPLGRLAGDPEPSVRLAALDALADHASELHGEDLRPIAGSNLAHPDKRVRQAAARLAALLPEPSWARLRADLADAPPQGRLTGALASAWRAPKAEFHDDVAETALGVLGATTDPGLRLQAVRLLAIALGDFNLDHPPVEAYTGYSLPYPLRGREALVGRILGAVRPLFPSGHGRLDEEVARLLAMLEDDDPGLPVRVAATWSDDSDPTRDMHYLIVFSRLRGGRGDALTPRVAQAVLGLSAKLQGKEQRNKQVWSERLAEVVASLLRRDPRLADALIDHPLFPAPGHVALVAGLDAGFQRRAARLFLTAERVDPAFPWSGPLVDLLGQLPDSEVRPIFREQWENFGLRDALLLQLAEGPEEADREKFLTGLDSAQPRVIQACLAALDRLPRDPSPEHLVPVLRLLRRLTAEPKERSLRARTLALLVRQSGEPAAVDEAADGKEELRKAYGPIFEAFERRHPSLARALNDSEDLASWTTLLRSVDWSKGDPARGEALFRARACQTCHSGTSRVGPDLTGVAGRFSRDDLFTSIIAPNQEVAPPYRTTVIETRDGQLVSGIVAFASADGLILQTGASSTMRIASEDIAGEQPSQRSLMPEGLLKDLKPADLADLDSYLRTLRPPDQVDRPARSAP